MGFENGAHNAHENNDRKSLKRLFAAGVILATGAGDANAREATPPTIDPQVTERPGTAETGVKRPAAGVEQKARWNAWSDMLRNADYVEADSVESVQGGEAFPTEVPVIDHNVLIKFMGLLKKNGLVEYHEVIDSGMASSDRQVWSFKLSFGTGTPRSFKVDFGSVNELMTQDFKLSSEEVTQKIYDAAPDLFVDEVDKEDPNVIEAQVFTGDSKPDIGAPITERKGSVEVNEATIKDVLSNIGRRYPEIAKKGVTFNELKKIGEPGDEQFELHLNTKDGPVTVPLGSTTIQWPAATFIGQIEIKLREKGILPAYD